MVLEEGWIPGRPARVGRVAGTPPEPPAAEAGYDNRMPGCCWRPWRRSGTRWRPSGPGWARTASGWCWAPAPPAWRRWRPPWPTWRGDGDLPPGFSYPGQEMGAPARFLARLLGLTGPAYTVSTACTSSGKALASARNLLRLGLCDAVVTGGADSLCRLTLNGFSSLGAATPGPANPMSVHRAGINIGEGAALFLLRREPAAIALLGAGASSDAYHISSPDPEGQGAETAMRLALARRRAWPARRWAT